MATAATLAARLVLDSSAYDRGLSQAQTMTNKFKSNLSSIGSSLTSLGGMMSAAFTVPIVGGATLAAKAYSDLDTQMQNIQSIATDLNDVQLYELRQTFIDMSMDMNVTRDSAVGLAEAYYFIQSAGFAGADGMTVLEVATKAASAGLTDTMVAGNAIIATLNAYGMGAEEAGYVSDVLFKTVDQGVLTFEELATQLGDVVNTAAMTSVPIDDVGAALVMMTRKGVSASESVTALNQLLLQFISPSQKMKDQAEEWGVAMDVSTLRTHGLAGALQLIIDKGGGTDALLTLFGDNVRALKGALTIGGEGLTEFTDLQEQFNDVTGRTQEAFLVQNKSVAAQMDNFKNKVTGLGLALAEMFIPILQELLDDYIIPLVDWLNALPKPMKFWLIIILALVAVIGPLLLFLGMMAMALTSIIALVTAVGLPFIILIVVIGLLIAAVVLLYAAWVNNWFGIQQKTEMFMLRIRIAVFALMTWASAFFSGQLGGWSLIFANAWNAIKTIFQLALSIIRFLVLAFQAAMRGDWYAFGTWMRQATNMWWIAVKTAFVTGFNNIMIFLNMAIQWIISKFQSVNWNSIGADIGNGIYNGLVSAANRILQLAQQVANAVAQAFSGFWGIHSPSSLMEYYAEMLGAGFDKGLEHTSLATTAPGVIANGQVPQGNLGTTGAQSDGTQTAVVELLKQLIAQQGSMDPVLFARALAQELPKYL